MFRKFWIAMNNNESSKLFNASCFNSLKMCLGDDVYKVLYRIILTTLNAKIRESLFRKETERHKHSQIRWVHCSNITNKQNPLNNLYSFLFVRGRDGRQLYADNEYNLAYGFVVCKGKMYPQSQKCELLD